MNQPLTMNTEMWIAVIIAGLAVGEDLWRRQISNWISIAAVVAGVGYQAATLGWPGLGNAALGCLVGFAAFLVFYLLGGMGGGDVKLMAGFGCLLGPGRSFEAALYTAMAGAVLALIVLGGSWIMRLLRRGTNSSPAPRSIPYAPAIAAGVLLALVPH